MKIEPIFRWFDIWVGLFIDTKKQTLYIFPVPMLGVKVAMKEESKWTKWDTVILVLLVLQFVMIITGLGKEKSRD